jgi:hypothetical protein
MPTLPLVLAGPILRRVEPQSVSVWIAFSEQQQVRLHLWVGNHAGKSEEELYTIDAAVHAEHPVGEPIATKRIGDHLHVAMVTLKITDPSKILHEREIYSYNLTFTGTDGLKDFKKIGYLNQEENTAQDNDKRKKVPLGYKKNSLPSFELPPAHIEDLNISHGSCRKMHGLGLDGLAGLDAYIKDNINGMEGGKKRPHQLFLTGDQIYADDVCMLALMQAAELGAQLFGNAQESIKIDNTTTPNVELNNFPPMLRKHLVSTKGGFTSDDSDSHLLGFREFCGLYLLSWNHALWEDEIFNIEKKPSTTDVNRYFNQIKTFINRNESLSTHNLLLDDALKAIFQDATKKTEWERGKLKSKLIEELKSFVDFRDELTRVQRVLANVPTYMIFDDHEVTDDWLLSGDWRQRVFSKPLGVNILRNGLMAYTLFQGWGNDPEQFTEGGDAPPERNQRKAKSDLLRHITQLYPEGATTGPATSAVTAIDTLLRLDGSDIPADLNADNQPVTWFYTVPSGSTTTYVLDTRTMRSYDDGLRAAPALLSDLALDRQLDRQLEADPNTEGAIIVVSPAPVLGMSLFEELIQPATAALGKSYKADFEAWSLNIAGFESFLNRLAPLQRVVLLSGDVHYGSSIAMDYWKNDGVTPRVSRFVQLTASAFKNGLPAPDRLLLSGGIQKLADNGLNTLFGGRAVPAERHGWRGNVTKSGRIASRHLIRLHANPVVLSPLGWIPGTSVSPPPDWQWRMKMIMDERRAADLPSKIQVLELATDFTEGGGNMASAYVAIIERHREAFSKAMGRRVVFPSNVGIVGFFKKDAQLFVRHRFWFQLTDDDSGDSNAYVQHDISLQLAALTDRPAALGTTS